MKRFRRIGKKRLPPGPNLHFAISHNFPKEKRGLDLGEMDRVAARFITFFLQIIPFSVGDRLWISF
jgi:hypothetical protein